MLYTVRKDNTISWKSNFYSLPLGTYGGRGTQVVVHLQDEKLVISNVEGLPLCQHQIALGKGLKIINTDHKRDKTGAIEELIEKLSLLTQVPQQTKEWLRTIHAAKPRYTRDQLLIIKRTIEKNEMELITKTILYCLENTIASAMDFNAIVMQQQRTTGSYEQKVIPLNPLSGTHLNKAMIQPQKSAIEDYQNVIKKSSK